MTDYVALGPIYAPGTSVAGYQRGHAVPASVVEAWELTVGDGPDAQVAEGSDLPAHGGLSPMDRPGPEANRSTWEKWAVVNGMSAEDAAAAAQEALEKIEAKKADAEAFETIEEWDRPDPAERPADSAPKADWIRYVIDSGGDRQWANDSATTKANLQAWQPATGDTVAVAATEANQA